MNISIFGLGYVGCVGMGCLSKSGHHIIGVDVNPQKINCINDGKAPIVENDIDQIIREQRRNGTICATADTEFAVANSEVSFICAGTPSTPNGHLECQSIFNIAEEIGRNLRNKNGLHVIAIRSTVLPGTNQKVSKIIEEVSGKRCNESFAVISNPEFLREGTAVKDFFCPPYTIIGGRSDEGIEKVKEIYKKIDSPIIVTDPEIAELIKYVNNAFHALKITFANEIGNICKKIGVNSHELMRLFCMDKKLNLSPYYLKPGFSYGGSCLPKDLKALRTIAHDQYLDCPVLENIERSNEFQKKLVLDNLIHLKKEKIGFLGLSFKGGTDDLRNSPIVDIIENLLGKGFDIRIYDKNVYLAQLLGANREYILSKIPYISKFIVEDPEELIDHSEIIVVVNNENSFAGILEKVSSEKIIYDFVNIDFKNKHTCENYMGIAW